MTTYVCKLAKLNKLGKWRTIRRVRQKTTIMQTYTIHELINANNHQASHKWIPVGILANN